MVAVRCALLGIIRAIKDWKNLTLVNRSNFVTFNSLKMTINLTMPHKTSFNSCTQAVTTNTPLSYKSPHAACQTKLPKLI